MEQFVPRVELSARSAQSSASPVALVGPCGAVGGRSTGRSPSRCWNGVEPPTLRLAVIVDQAFSNVSYSEPGVNQYNDPARNCQYVPRPGLMTQAELITYCNSGGPLRHRRTRRGSRRHHPGHHCRLDRTDPPGRQVINSV